jgi:hypothetical protein
MSKEPFFVPKIKRTFFKKEVRYYETVDGKIWDANIYDTNFKIPKTPIRKKSESEAVNLSKEFVARRHPRR